MKKLIVPIAALLFAIPFATTAQKLVSEKTYEVDKKAKRGYLDEVVTNPTDKTTTLSFVTKATGNKVKYQDYIFDKDYNFVKVVESEDQLYRNKKYKGDNYFVEGISVEVSMLGKMVLKKKRIEYNWNWFQGGYVKKVILLDKVKPKDESGNSYMVLKKFENDETGEVIALVTAVGKTAVAGQLFFMKIDKDLKIEIVDKNTFTNLKGLKATFLVPSEGTVSDGEESDDEDISTSDICFIFAGFEDKKNKESELNYEMWRVSHEGKIKNKLEFKVKTGFWNIESAIADKGSLYFVGPANEETSSKPLDEIKWKFYQLAKITGDKVDYVSSTNMDEFEAKLKKPASQKKNPAYSGKRFRFAKANVSPDGSLFICGQNAGKEELEAEVLMFYFDNTGKLKAQYGVRLEERNDDSKKIRARQYIEFEGNSAFWTLLENSGSVGGDYPKSLIYPSIAKIDLASAEIGEFVKFGTVKDKPTYFLQNNFPFITNPADHSLIYLGVDKPGRVFWFGKITLE